MKKYLLAYGLLFVALVGLFWYLGAPLYVAVILTAVGMGIQWFKVAL